MKIRLIFLLISLLVLAPFARAGADDIVVSGVVKDKSTKKKLEGVSLIVNGSNIGTVSNADGTFSLKIPVGLSGNGFRAEQTGYRSHRVNGNEIKSNNGPITIWLEPSVRMLDEVTVYGAEPRNLVEKAIDKIPQNYSSSPALFSSFYRETIQKGKRYVGVSEAIVNVLKKPYKTRVIAGDKVQVMKGRRLVSQRANDTIAVKILGGPNLPVLLDVVKNENVLFTLDELDYYDFKMEPMTSVDDRRQFVVSFTPRVTVDYALHNGKVYIDAETLTFTRAEFSLDISNKDKATRAILYKKPYGLHFTPREMTFIVTYKYQDGLAYLNYIQAKTRFNCDWKRKLFSSGFTVLSEMVMVDRQDNPETDIPRKLAFGQRDIFYDKVDDFRDENFWKDYNIIEPTQSLEKAVLKLRR